MDHGLLLRATVVLHVVGPKRLGMRLLLLLLLLMLVLRSMLMSMLMRC